jgi:hypothetical protein
VPHASPSHLMAARTPSMPTVGLPDLVMWARCYGGFQYGLTPALRGARMYVWIVVVAAGAVWTVFGTRPKGSPVQKAQRQVDSAQGRPTPLSGRSKGPSGTSSALSGRSKGPSGTSSALSGRPRLHGGRPVLTSGAPPPHSSSLRPPSSGSRPPSRGSPPHSSVLRPRSRPVPFNGGPASLGGS